MSYAVPAGAVRSLRSQTAPDSEPFRALMMSVPCQTYGLFTLDGGADAVTSNRRAAGCPYCMAGRRHLSSSMSQRSRPCDTGINSKCRNAQRAERA